MKISVIIAIAITASTILHITAPEEYKEYWALASFNIAIIAIVWAAAMFNTFREEKHFREEFGIPSLLNSINEIEQSVLALGKVLKNKSWKIYNMQISNILQQLHHTQTGLLQYSIGENSAEMLGDVIQTIGSPEFSLTEKDIDDTQRIDNLDLDLYLIAESLQMVYKTVETQKKS